ncbi:MAG: hypothetical protein AB7V46_16050 [Thermomicrobiales bacterium]
MSRSITALLGEVRSRVHSLLYDEVIQHTIVVMSELSNYMSQLASAVRAGPLTEEIKVELRNVLLSLTSESIREALHKNELHITNRIIRAKNNILTAIGEEIPEGHREIDPNDFAGYSW